MALYRWEDQVKEINNLEERIRDLELENKCLKEEKLSFLMDKENVNKQM